MDAVIFHAISWPTLGCALLVFGFAPGALQRLIVLLYPRDHPSRRELIGDLYAYPRIERPFWVAQQLETALFEGLGGRLAAWHARWPVTAIVRVEQPGRGRIVRLRWRITAELRRPDVQVKDLMPAFQRALSAGQFHLVDYTACRNRGPQRVADAAGLVCWLRNQLKVGGWCEGDAVGGQAPEAERSTIRVIFCPPGKPSPLLSDDGLCPTCGMMC